MMPVRWIATLLAGSALAACGCADPYQDGRSPAASISRRAVWRAGGDVRSPQYAVDGDPATAAVSSAADHTGMLTIDLGKPCLFNMVVIEHGHDEHGFAGRVAVLTSLDGQIFTHRYAAAGTRKVTTLWLGEAVLARYVRLQVLVGGNRPWSVAEVHLQ